MYDEYRLNYGCSLRMDGITAYSGVVEHIGFYLNLGRRFDSSVPRSRKSLEYAKS